MSFFSSAIGFEFVRQKLRLANVSQAGKLFRSLLHATAEQVSGCLPMANAVLPKDYESR